MSIVNLYKVVWRNNRHKNPEINTSFVAAAAGSGAVALASTIQTSNNDGKTVTVDALEVVQTGIIS